MSDDMSDDMTKDTPTGDAPEKPAQNAAISGASALPHNELNKLTDDIIAGLKSVYDPEIPADIYEIGLIYKIDIVKETKVTVVWDPPWDPSRMSDEARLVLNMW
jgi:metal-sulfur cluster biosynthetic enzyme